MHTPLCRHATGEPEEYALAATTLEDAYIRLTGAVSSEETEAVAV